MQQNKYYKEFAASFATKSISELVESFNHETRNTGWVSIRGYYNHAIIDEFIRRCINVSAVYDGNAISLSHPVQYDEENKKLVVPPEASNSTTTFEIY